jgi:hypothetical protein
MSVKLTYEVVTRIEEVLAGNTPDVVDSEKKVIHAAWDSDKVLDASSTPPASLTASFEAALIAGSLDIDLRALVGTNSIPVDGSGKKVQMMKVMGKAGNANFINIKKGVANGYDGFGAAFQADVLAGGELTFYTNDGGNDISGTNYNLTLTGIGTQVLKIILVLG